MLDLIEQDKQAMGHLNGSLTVAKEDLLNKNIELEKALQITQQAKDEISEFTSMISHELRTPIAILQCELELLIEGIAEPSADNLESLLEEVLHLNTLIQDMFELALSDTRMLKYEMNNISVKQIIERSIERFESQFKDNVIEVSVELDQINSLDVFGDLTRLKQVFDNILKNSLSYTDANGQLNVVSSKSNDTIKIVFQDSVPGVPPSALDKLCTRFYRVDESRSRETGGSGLGLAICKTIIEDHNGTFNVKNSPLGGLSVIIELPFIPETQSGQ
jgi:two-component system sensor histidine kinase BaeS